ncbi:Protein of unknown function DUF597 [Macleaya cordata]|uniref:PLATZ transcription factor family protein n=1 Tax=Macleaya cordata TaxID=56857 RepID=A0A200R9S8_MACCD|nr:Protein of unknown function DUF597 [Macleaya cordata]
MYCLDCNLDAFCFYCRSSKHKDHPVIQIRRSSYHDVVRVGEIQKFIDIDGVQTYVINSARVLFLNERPQPKGSSKGGGGGGGGVSHICEICGRSLLDPFRFCSLGCKLVGIKKNKDASFILDVRKNNVEVMRGDHDEGRSREEGQLMREGTQHHMYPLITSPPPSSINPRRRKGIPHRAPFGT